MTGDMAAISIHPPWLRPGGDGFSLVELLVVIACIAVLMTLLLPALAAVRESQRRSQAAAQVAQVHQAVQSYAAEEARHRYPPQGGADDRALRWAPGAAPPGNLNLVSDRGIDLDLSALDRSGPPPYVLTDPWRRPYQYQVDGDLLGATGPQRPLDLPAWNEAGRRPWAYVWSLGRLATADGTGWIYPRDDR